MNSQSPIKCLIAYLPLALLSVGLPAAHAAPVTVSNFSFESPNVGTGYNQTGTVSQASDTAVAGFGFDGFIGSGNAAGLQSAPTNAADGSQIAYINQLGDLYQDIGLLLPSTVYTLTVAVGPHPTGFGTGSGTFGQIQILNGTDDTGTSLVSSGSINVPTPITNPGAMSDYTITFTSPAVVSGDLTIDLQNISNAASTEVNFDNVRLDASAAIPEPSTGIAAAGGLVLLATGNFRRRLKA